LSKDHISIYKGQSNIEISRIDDLPIDLYRILSALSDSELFYFNRIRAFPEGEGIGTELMEELVKILDKQDIALYCELNPYGLLDYKALEKFYKKYGFEEFGVDGALIRLPRKENRNENQRLADETKK